MSSGNGDCSDASCDPSSPSPNVDMDGIAVSVASVVLTLCLRILITWSPEDVGVGVQASFLQIYPILLSTLFSINRQQLSSEDVGFALNLTSSPLMAYLVFASICDLCGAKTGLYKRIKSHRRITRSLGVFIVPLWLALTGVAVLSTSAFTDSGGGDDGTPVGEWFLYLESFIMDVLQPGLFPYFGIAAIGTFSVLFLFRSWSQFVVEVRPCLRSKPWGWFRLPHTFIKGAWCIIHRNHKWFIYTVFAYMDFSWVFIVIANSLGDFSDGYVYVLSYGQVLSVFAAVPPLILTADFIYSSRFDLLRTVQSFPTRSRAEVVFLLTGKKPDHLVHDILPLTSPAPIPRVPQDGPCVSPPEEPLQSENPTSPPKIPVDGLQDDVTTPNMSHTHVFFFPYDIIAS